MTKKRDDILTPIEANQDFYRTEPPTIKNTTKIRFSKKIITIIGIIVILFVILFFFLSNVKNQKTNESYEAVSPKTNTQKQAELNTYLDIDPITVGLSPSGPKKEHLKIDLTLRLNTEEESASILTKMPIIKDSLITFLRTLRSSDFNSSSSTIYLKEEIAKRINKITSPIEIKEVLFQEILVN